MTCSDMNIRVENPKTNSIPEIPICLTKKTEKTRLMHVLRIITLFFGIKLLMPFSGLIKKYAETRNITTPNKNIKNAGSIDLFFMA